MEKQKIVKPKTNSIIFLHGFPASTESWSATAHELSKKGYNILLPEQRGYSEALRPKKRRDYKLSLLAGDIIRLMDDKHIEQAHIVGHDWGGVVAWALASWYPERVGTLTVVSTPHPQALLSSLWSSKQILLSWYMFFFQLPYLPEYVMSKHNGRALQNMLEKTGLTKSTAQKYVEYMLHPGRLTGAINWYRAIPYTLQETRTINSINVPTLFVYGEKDNFLSTKAAVLTQQWVEGVYEYEALPDGTHWLPEESPDALATLIEKHLHNYSVTEKQT